MDPTLGLVPQDGHKIRNSPPANSRAGRAGGSERDWSHLHRSQTHGINLFPLFQKHTQVDSNEPHQHQSFSKIYQSASSSISSNSLSQLPFKPSQKQSKPALTPGQQQCHPSTFPPTTPVLYIAPSSKKLRGCCLFFCAVSPAQPCTSF